MIVRMSEARVRPGLLAEFRAFIADGVRDFTNVHDGLLDAEILVDESTNTLIYLSRWRDEAALERFAGPEWATAPVTLPGSDPYLLSPLTVRHFVVTQ